MVRRDAWPHSKPEDPLDIATIQITEAPCIYPPLMGYYNSQWTILCEYTVSEFPNDRFFLVEFLAMTVIGENRPEEIREYMVFHGRPLPGIGGREIAFVMPDISWDWESFYKRCNYMSSESIGKSLPQDDESLDKAVLEAIFRLKDWRLGREMVERQA